MFKAIRGVNKQILACAVMCFVLLAVVACDEFATSSESVQQKGQQTLAEQQASLTAAQPAPQLSYSQERAQQIDKAELFADPDKIGYIYLINYGKVMAFYPVKGKISSLNTYLSTQATTYGSSSGGWTTIPAPDIDGTYGSNADSIFFFTPQGAYIEWHGDYMYSDTPLQMSTPPEIVYVAPLK